MTARSITSWKSAPATGVQVAGGGDGHRGEAESHAGEHALARDVQRASAGVHCVGDAVDPVDGDDGVGGLRGDRRAGHAHRDAEVGERQRGRVVDAVADHDHRAQRRVVAQPADDLELLLGGLLGVDAVDAELARRPARRPTGGRRRPSRRGGRPRRAVARRSGRRRGAARRPSRSRRRRGRRCRRARAPRRSRGRAARPRRRSRPRVLPAARRNARLPTATDAAVDRACDALAGLLVDVGRACAASRPASAAARTSASPSTCADMLSTEAASRSSSAGLAIVDRDDLANLGRADGQRAGLVEQDGARLAERLDRAGALDDHAVAGGAREARDERDRRGEDQRARRRDDDDRQRPHRVAADRPREAGDDQRGRAGRSRRSGRPSARTARAAPAPARPAARAPRRRSRPRGGRRARRTGRRRWPMPLSTAMPGARASPAAARRSACSCRRPPRR